MICNLNSFISFDLPSEFHATKEAGDDGYDTVFIRTKGFSDGAEFVCGADYVEYTPEDLGDVPPSELLDELANSEKEWFVKGFKKLCVSETPKIIMMEFFNALDRTTSIKCLVQIPQINVFEFMTTFIIRSTTDLKFAYEKLYEIMKSVRINNQALPVNDITPDGLLSSLHD